MEGGRKGDTVLYSKGGGVRLGGGVKKEDTVLYKKEGGG
jgi:hypothetical protein